jgi:transposase
MTDLTLPDFPITAKTLIGEARAARERHADEQVAAHIRGVLSRLKSHKPKGDAHALR